MPSLIYIPQIMKIVVQSIGRFISVLLLSLLKPFDAVNCGKRRFELQIILIGIQLFPFYQELHAVNLIQLAQGIYNRINRQQLLPFAAGVLQHKFLAQIDIAGAVICCGYILDFCTDRNFTDYSEIGAFPFDRNMV